jgi:hypothetical protein
MPRLFKPPWTAEAVTKEWSRTVVNLGPASTF